MRFSSRLQSKKRELILDDAPRPLRIGYIKAFLGEFVGDAAGHRQPRHQPLDSEEIHKKFIALVREEKETWDFDGQSNWERLIDHIKHCDWTSFFDFVELVGQLLIEIDDEIPFDSSRDFRSYQSKVNDLFEEDRIGWILNDNSRLYRRQNKKISAVLKSIDNALSDSFSAARSHYLKSERYLYQHPIDEANCIKEIISAIESVAKVIDPRISTLGDATKKLRANPNISQHLLDALEKINVYSNATPLVRHGHANGHGPSIEEAELLFVVGIAYIRYLISVSKEQPIPPNKSS